MRSGSEERVAQQGAPVVSWLRRPAVAAAVVLVAYALLSLFMHPHGYLGTDTGGKVATLDVMSTDRTLDPDLGYWAEEWDPDGELHPVYFTRHLGDRWVNVTTLPMVYVALPLYDLGGYRLALVVPMLGGLAAAFAARALARRMGDRDGWPAFWITALASPVAIYALDFWEHTVGLALVAWAVVAAMDWVTHRRPALAVASGLAFGLAFTMRTEAGVYAAVTLGVVAVLLARGGRHLLIVGAAGFAGAGAVVVAMNWLLERAVLGTTRRSGRSVAAARRGFDAVTDRLEEGLVTTTALSASRLTLMAVLGVAFTGGACLLAAWARGPRRRRAAALLAVILAGVLAVRFGAGLGFVPGLVPATPFAAVAIVLGWRDRVARTVTALALVALPAVWAFQYLGGARPQWGGRYVLASGLLLGVVGIVASTDLGWVRTWFVGAAVAVTAFGLVWQSDRTHSIASARQALEARDEPVLVSRQAFFLRELGPAFQGRQWLTVAREGDLPRLDAVLAGAAVDRFALLQTDSQGAPPAIGGFEVVDGDHHRWVRTDFTVYAYERTPGP